MLGGWLFYSSVRCINIYNLAIKDSFCKSSHVLYSYIVKTNCVIIDMQVCMYDSLFVHMHDYTYVFKCLCLAPCAMRIYMHTCLAICIHMWKNK